MRYNFKYLYIKTNTKIKVKSDRDNKIKHDQNFYISQIKPIEKNILTFAKFWEIFENMTGIYKNSCESIDTYYIEKSENGFKNMSQ